VPRRQLAGPHAPEARFTPARSQVSKPTGHRDTPHPRNGGAGVVPE
jgi:hypothetical protein